MLHVFLHGVEGGLHQIMSLSLHLIQLDIQASHLCPEGTGGERVVRLRRPMDCGCSSWWRRWWLKAHQSSCSIRGSPPRTRHCGWRRRQQCILVCLVAFHDCRQVITFWRLCRGWDTRTCRCCWGWDTRTCRWCWGWDTRTCRWCWRRDFLRTCRWCWWWILSSTCRWCWRRDVPRTCRWCWWWILSGTCRWCWRRDVPRTCRWCWRRDDLRLSRRSRRPDILIQRQCLRDSRGRERNLCYFQLDRRWWWWWQG